MGTSNLPMNGLNPFAARRAQMPREGIPPSPPDELIHRLAVPFRDAWERLRTAAGQCDHLTLRSVGAFRTGHEIHEVPRAVFTGPKSGGDPIRLAVFAGVGGDDRLAREAVVRFLLGLSGDPSRATGVEVFAYLVPDPAALASPEATP
ncbi:MAG: hypothetical protein KIT22_15105, partial [Verrucomicrobiae bacterium]|nr:hypothetical protein [Verrucomicrobiae bacterium]